MTTPQPAVDFPEAQSAVYGLALSLDAFLLNGIPCGVLQGGVFPGFLEKAGRNLMRDLAGLEEQASHDPNGNTPEVAAILASLRARCQQLIDLVAGLRLFPSLPVEQMRLRVSEIPALRGECVSLIQQLEASLRLPKPFYSSRPAHSTALVDGFLADLERSFDQAWVAAQTGREKEPAR